MDDEPNAQGGLRDMQLLSESLPPDALTSRIPALPVELLVKIGTHLDNHTLWLGYARVSRMFRVEAEREFMRSRMPKLRLSWRVSFKLIFDGGYNDRIFTIKRLSHFSNDNRVVFFDVTDGHCPPFKTNSLLNVDKEAELTFYRRQLSCTEWDLNRNLCDRSIVLGGRVRQVELPGLEIDFKKRCMSFEWKLFLADFLSDQVLQRNQRRKAEANMKFNELVNAQKVQRKGAMSAWTSSRKNYRSGRRNGIDYTWTS
ncbi:hypothetical protein T440DRAFT_521931 [Plenodomus tracheiphilus IPT5]|uniref:F-box domain-containing protein n=1 Tax=Plenodomus tracheiphilus IPT5 TaxID=1408161 RepID=A0A6A7AS76_9PLEO|nr:hypothetical protein T440DRAFT_521931 [Plenodomus tracheiphilus IPT5]